MRKIFGYIVLGCLLFVIGKVVWERNKLKSNFDLSVATIVDAGNYMAKNGNWEIRYKFKVKDGSVIFASQNLPLIFAKKDSLIGRTVPCAYYRKNYNKSEMLIYERTWKQYGLRFPDTLSWTHRYFNDMIYSY